MKLREDLKAYGKLATTKAGPVAGQVEVTSSCFQHCRACESWRDDRKGVIRGLWSLEQLQDLCQQLAQTGTFEHLSLTGGDPQDWPHLVEFLAWFKGFKRAMRRPFKLQLNTALARDIRDPHLWREVVDDVRVSLDAVDPVLYQKIRNDKETGPADVLRRMVELRHPRLATNTTVFPETLFAGEVTNILQELSRRLVDERLVLRKAIFLAVIGPRGGDRDEVFWEKWEELRLLRSVVPTSFAENVAEVRRFVASPEASDVKCWAGNISFHIKANGDWYPCCLAGGEAIETYPELKTGNFFKTGNIWELLEAYEAKPHYANPLMPCREICQWKQLQINLAGHACDGNTLSMP